MPWNKVVQTALSPWLEGDGPHTDVVLSSRVRLARNLNGFSYPHLLQEAQARRVVEAVAGGVKAANLVGVSARLELYPLWEAPLIDRQVLVEKHLISPDLARDARGKAVAISEDEMVSIMVNEEDHLRTQVLLSGLQPDAAWQVASRVDDALEEKLSYAFHQLFGYLTACPTNVGTGLRASVMVHLPTLAMTGQVHRLLGTVGQVGLAVRGYFGEGTNALGHIYQISNQITLGRSEEDIISNLMGMVQRIIEHERVARQHLTGEKPAQLQDRIGRAYGLLSGARIMSSEEAMRLLSDLRLGIDLGLVTGIDHRTVNELLVATRPAFLQRIAGRELTHLERDVQRATEIRQRLASGTAV